MKLFSPCQTSSENTMPPAESLPVTKGDHSSSRPDVGSPSSPATRLPTKHHYSRSEGQSPSASTSFSKLLDSVLGSSSSVSKRIEPKARESFSRSSLVSRTDYSIIDIPTSPTATIIPNNYNDFSGDPRTTTSPDLLATCNSRNLLAVSPLKKSGAFSSDPPLSAGKPRNKRILPRLWTTLASPAKDPTSSMRFKGKQPDYDAYDSTYPLDGEEGELIDDEACFVETRGIDILTSLPPEVALEVLNHLDVKTILICLRVSRNWGRLASDPFIWRKFFYDSGWEINQELACKVAVKTDVHKVSLSSRSPVNRFTRTSITSRRSSMYNQSGRYSVASAAFRTDCNLAPLSLDWKLLYKTRAEIERRVCGNPTSAVDSANGGTVGEEPRTMTLSGHLDSVYCLEFDHEKIITGSRDRSIKVWSLQSGNLKATLCGHNGSVLSLKFDNSGFMVSGSSDRTILVWDLNKGDIKKKLYGHEGGVLDLRIDRQWIVSCSKDTVVRVWNRVTLELYHAFHGHDGPVNSVGLQDGKIVSASGDMKIILWDIVTKTKLQTFSGHEAGLACVEFKGDFICSGSNDNTIKVWSVSTGQCLTTLSGHRSLVRALSFNPITGRLVSGSYDRTVKIWNIHTGKLVREFKNIHDSHIFDAKFDASHIISTSHDRKVVVLDWSYGLDSSLFL